jgi:murein DD-endopeptidase MepM/ murein hydrolase activator NlpD
VRSFPRTARRRVLAVSLTALVIGALVVPSADASKGHSLQDQQKSAQGQVNQAQRDLDGQSKQLTAAQDALAAAQQQLTAAKAHLATVTGQLAGAEQADQVLQEQLAAARATLTQAQGAVTAGQQDVAQQKVAAQTAILQNYLQGDPALREVQTLLDGRPLAALTSQEAYGAAVTGLQTNAYQQLQSSQVLLTVHAHDLKTAAAQVAVEEKAAAAKVAEVQTLQAQAQAAKDAVAQKVTASQQAESAAEAAKRADQQALAAAKAKEQRIERQILKQAAQGRNRVVATDGMFYPPVLDTYITSPFGWRIHPIYGYRSFHDGDDLHAPCGTAEHAVQGGRVAQEYYSDVWGNRLFLDMGKINGHSWVGIYNHIEQYKVSTGAVVTQGETMALAGTTGWSTACHLHFTLMRDGVAVNPADYIHFG